MNELRRSAGQIWRFLMRSERGWSCLVDLFLSFFLSPMFLWLGGVCVDSLAALTFGWSLISRTSICWWRILSWRWELAIGISRVARNDNDQRFCFTAICPISRRASRGVASPPGGSLWSIHLFLLAWKTTASEKVQHDIQHKVRLRHHNQSALLSDN